MSRRYKDRKQESSSDDTNKEKKYTFKVCLSGRSGVGKTSIFNRLRGKPFEEFPIAETDTYSFKTTSRRGSETKDVTLLVWDTAGMERNTSLTLGYYRSAHLIIGVFDFGKKDTMYDLEDSSRSIIESGNCPEVQFCFAGNKTDLAPRDVEENEVVAFLTNNEVLGPITKRVFFTSAKNNNGIQQMFQTAADILIGLDVQPVIHESLTAFQNRYSKPSSLSCCP